MKIFHHKRGESLATKKTAFFTGALLVATWAMIALYYAITDFNSLIAVITVRCSGITLLTMSLVMFLVGFSHTHLIKKRADAIDKFLLSLSFTIFFCMFVILFVLLMLEILIAA